MINIKRLLFVLFVCYGCINSEHDRANLKKVSITLPFRIEGQCNNFPNETSLAHQFTLDAKGEFLYELCSNKLKKYIIDGRNAKASSHVKSVDLSSISATYKRLIYSDQKIGVISFDLGENTMNKQKSGTLITFDLSLSPVDTVSFYFPLLSVVNLHDLDYHSWIEQDGNILLNKFYNYIDIISNDTILSYIGEGLTIDISTRKVYRVSTSKRDITNDSISNVFDLNSFVASNKKLDIFKYPVRVSKGNVFHSSDEKVYITNIHTGLTDSINISIGRWYVREGVAFYPPITPFSEKSFVQVRKIIIN